MNEFKWHPNEETNAVEPKSIQRNNLPLYSNRSICELAIGSNCYCQSEPKCVRCKESQPKRWPDKVKRLIFAYWQKWFTWSKMQQKAVATVGNRSHNWPIEGSCGSSETVHLAGALFTTVCLVHSSSSVNLAHAKSPYGGNWAHTHKDIPQNAMVMDHQNGTAVHPIKHTHTSKLLVPKVPFWRLQNGLINCQQIIINPENPHNL